MIFVWAIIIGVGLWAVDFGTIYLVMKANASATGTLPRFPVMFLLIASLPINLLVGWLLAKRLVKR